MANLRISRSPKELILGLVTWTPTDRFLVNVPYTLIQLSQATAIQFAQVSDLRQTPHFRTMTLVRSLYPTQQPRSGQIPRSKSSSDSSHIAGTISSIGSLSLRDSAIGRLPVNSDVRFKDSTDRRNYHDTNRTYLSSFEPENSSTQVPAMSLRNVCGWTDPYSHFSEPARPRSRSPTHPDPSP
jgi:hypothetical protein